MLPGMDKPKFTPLKPNATFTDDLKSFNISDISIWGATTAVSFPIGYAIGKPVRTPLIWIMVDLVVYVVLCLLINVPLDVILDTYDKIYKSKGGR